MTHRKPSNGWVSFMKRDPIPYCMHKGKPCHEQSSDWNHTAICNAQHHADSLQVAAQIVRDLADTRDFCFCFNWLARDQVSGRKCPWCRACEWEEATDGSA